MQPNDCSGGDAADRAVAVVGLGAVLPDALSVPAFWQNLLARRSSIRGVPPHRWSVADFYDPDRAAPDKTYSAIGGWVEGYRLDWRAHRLPPRVVEVMDESQKWAVTMTAEALADYGWPRRPLPLERTGIVLGTSIGGDLQSLTGARVRRFEFESLLRGCDEFSRLPALERERLIAEWDARVCRFYPRITEDSMPGELANVVAGRVANVFNLNGPNFIADAACASSLAAFDVAVQCLVQRRCDAVLAGGVDSNMAAPQFVRFAKIGALSATGSRPFAAGADGFVMAEGGAIFLLKRLADAEAAGDRIYAVIRAVAGSSDGKGKGIAAPNPAGQQLALRRAWSEAGLDPATATLVEAHGTSTAVGDVAEAQTLAQVFAGAPAGSIALGSVKGNLGHLKAAAGAAGLLKAALAVHHRVLPATLNAERPNPEIPFGRTPFALNCETREWPVPACGVRRAGVSSFGFGGTNFHAVLEEHRPGTLRARAPQVQLPAALDPRGTEPALVVTSAQPQPSIPAPLRGIFALGAPSVPELSAALSRVLERLADGPAPDPIPDFSALRAEVRLVVDFGSREELRERLARTAQLDLEDPANLRVLQGRGVFFGRGGSPGKVAFLFPGQGSQFPNMGRALAGADRVVSALFQEADAVLAPLLGEPLTAIAFCDAADRDALRRAEQRLARTEVTQPAMLTLDVAFAKLLSRYGFGPDLAMGHSLGEYAALVVSGAIPLADALRGAVARAQEMARVSAADPGAMAAVMAPLERIEATLPEIDGYVVAANLNSPNQAVLAGETRAVERAVARFAQMGFEAVRLPVSHAFHSRIVASAGPALRAVLERLDFSTPRLPVVSNVTGEFYPAPVPEMRELLVRQIASPVQFVRGLETLYRDGARVFVEVGPKAVLKGFVDEVLGKRPGVVSLFCNRPRTGELESFNQALCGLFAAGCHPSQRDARSGVGAGSKGVAGGAPARRAAEDGAAAAAGTGGALAAGEVRAPGVAPAAWVPSESQRVGGSVVISGTGLGLPGTRKPVMDPQNLWRLLRGEQLIEPLPHEARERIADKRIERVVKGEDGSGSLQTIDGPEQVLKLAGRAGSFDLSAEYGVSDRLVAEMDLSAQLALAAGLDALREAGLPLTLRYRTASTGKPLPDRWMLPEPLRDETGVIFASALPGLDAWVGELSRYEKDRARRETLALLTRLRARATEPALVAELDQALDEERAALEREPYAFDRRLLFRAAAFGHGQIAEFIGARGPVAHLNAASAGTTAAVSLAEDWIRAGRCRRVLIASGDCATSERLLEWVGSAFLAAGAAATDERVEDAALPFGRRRHGTLLGMGACALVLESEDALRERGMAGSAELLASELVNSAFHPTRLDPDHIAQAMDRLVSRAERRYGFTRGAIAAKTAFVSHESYTPARGGSASAEITALRRTFGDAARDVLVTNAKAFTGHGFGVGFEDVLAAKILELGEAPPIPGLADADPELGILNLSKGGRCEAEYALRVAAGFCSQVAMTLLRRIPRAAGALVERERYEHWLAEVTGCEAPQTEVVRRVLRVVDRGAPVRRPRASLWCFGDAPRLEAASAGGPPLANGVAPAASAPAEADRGEQRERGDAELSGTDIDEIVLAIVADRSGYPRDMLDLQLELEADLGIDTVKQAEIFAAVRERFGVPRPANLRLSDYRTLASLTALVRSWQGPAGAVPAAGRAAEEARAPASATPAADGAAARTGAAPVPPPTTPGARDVDEVVLAIVAERSGYPRDMLDLQLELEADLGIDTVKQAEIFAAVRERYGVPRPPNLRLSDYRTLASLTALVRSWQPDAAAAAAPVQVQDEAGAISGAPAVAPGGAAEIEEAVLAIVADRSGYPRDMLELQLELEADLGIDTVKQAEIFAAVRGRFGMPRPPNLRLSDYRTLASLVALVRTWSASQAATPGVGVASGASSPEGAAEHGWPGVANAAPANPQAGAAPEEPALRPLVATLRPAASRCKSTGLSLAGKRVLVALDERGVGELLLASLRRLGALPLPIPVGGTASALSKMEARVRAILQDGRVDGVFWLPGLDPEPDLDTLRVQSWRTLNAARVKALYRLMRLLDGCFVDPGGCLVAATRSGGLHGADDQGAASVVDGAIAGFCKAFKRERPGALVKVVDFEPTASAERVEEALLEESLRDPGIVEIGRRGRERYGVAPGPSLHLAEQPLLPEGAVFLITGGSGGIVGQMIAELARSCRGTFHLLARTPPARPDDEEIVLLRRSRDELKRHLLERERRSGKRPAPAVVEKRLAVIERAEAALRAVELVEEAGGIAQVHPVDIADRASLQEVVDRIFARHARLDVVVHAAGLACDHRLADKTPEEFDAVYDVKVDGLFHLLQVTRERDVGSLICFGSIAGRFGNGGQTDYSAANDLLARACSHLQRLRPGLRALCIDWTAFASVGMAARGSVPQLMAEAGIELLAPRTGAAMMRTLVGTASARREILAAGRLGRLAKDWDETGGVDAAATLASPHPLLGRFASLGSSGLWRFETTLDPRGAPFLRDHRLEGTALLPGVMGVEAFAALARRCAPRHEVVGFEEVRFSPVKFHRDEPRTLVLEARITRSGEEALLAEARLGADSGTRPGASGAASFSGRVLMARMFPERPAPVGVATGAPDAVVEADAIYRALFHGPCYRVLDRVERRGAFIEGVLAQDLASEVNPGTGELVLAPRLLELVLQSAAVWSLAAQGELALPVELAQVEVYGPAPDLRNAWRARVVPSSTEGATTFDADVFDGAGELYLRVRGYRTARRAEPAAESLWTPLRDGLFPAGTPAAAAGGTWRR